MTTKADEPATHRLANGEVITWAKPRFTHIQARRYGAIHLVREVIIRWNFLGGTREKPDVSVVLLCGPQARSGTTFTDPPKGATCRSCLKRERKGRR